MKPRQHYDLQRLLQELDNALEGMNQQEQAWTLAELRAECGQRMLRLDPATRHQAEIEATSPTKFLRRIRG